MLRQYPGKVKLITKHFPLRNHKFAKLAAEACLAADRQGKYWELHDLLLENYNKLNRDKIIELAEAVGVDAKQLQKDMKDKAIAAKLRSDMQDGQRVGVRGTPSIFIDGRRVRDRSVAGMSKMVEEALSDK